MTCQPGQKETLSHNLSLGRLAGDWGRLAGDWEKVGRGLGRLAGDWERLAGQ